MERVDLITNIWTPASTLNMPESKANAEHQVPELGPIQTNAMGLNVLIRYPHLTFYRLYICIYSVNLHTKLLIMIAFMQIVASV